MLCTKHTLLLQVSDNHMLHFTAAAALLQQAHLRSSRRVASVYVQGKVMGEQASYVACSEDISFEEEKEETDKAESHTQALSTLVRLDTCKFKCTKRTLLVGKDKLNLRGFG